jgi:hypothetical protein
VLFSCKKNAKKIMKQDEKRKKVTQKGGGDKIQHSFKLI